MQAIKRRPSVRRGGVIYLSVEDIDPSPVQPRKTFDDGDLNELSQSIAEYGILNPLTVRLRDNRYELVAGERRLRAAKLAGLVEVPCILLDVGLEDASLIALIENLQRRDLDFIEEANGLKQLIDLFGMSQEEAARRLGKSQSAVANKLRLLKLPQDVRASASFSTAKRRRTSESLPMLASKSVWSAPVTRSRRAVRSLSGYSLSIGSSTDASDRLSSSSAASSTAGLISFLSATTASAASLIVPK